MPGFDKTGPTGQGSNTGRGMGRCRNEKETPTEELSTRIGRGLGKRLRLGGNSPTQGKGMGRKFRGGN